MSGHDTPEFDDFESTNEPDQEAYLRPDPESSQQETGDTGPAGPDSDNVVEVDGTTHDTGSSLLPVADSAGHTLQPVIPSALNGQRTNGRNSYRPPARRPKFPQKTVSLPGRQAPPSSPPAATTAVSAPPISSGKHSSAYALMETLAVWAMHAKKRSEAGQLVAAMVPLAVQHVSRYRRELQPVLPVLIRGAASVAELMHAEDARGLIALMPPILDQTMHRLAGLAAHGRTIDPAMATDVLAEFTSALIEQSQDGSTSTTWDNGDEY